MQVVSKKKKSVVLLTKQTHFCFLISLLFGGFGKIHAYVPIFSYQKRDGKKGRVKSNEKKERQRAKCRDDIIKNQNGCLAACVLQTVDFIRLGRETYYGRPSFVTRYTTAIDIIDRDIFAVL
jgi:hypothetical protein